VHKHAQSKLAGISGEKRMEERVRKWSEKKEVKRKRGRRRE
jgi:hypothetical protein